MYQIEFWPLGVGVLEAVLVALALMIVMIRVQRPNVSNKGPRHRRNQQKPK